MMTARARFYQADLVKALTIAMDKGLQPTRVSIAADGAIEIDCAPLQVAPPSDPFDLVDMRRKP